MSEKTEQPTEKKLRDGRKEGQIVKSSEITSGVQLVVVLLFFHFFTDTILQRITALFSLTLDLINKPFWYALTIISHQLLINSGLLLAIFGGMLMVMTVSAIMLQVGLVMATKVIFRGDRINPVNNLKQIFSLHSVVELIKSTLKVVLLGLIFSTLFYFYAPTFQALPYCGIECALPVFSTLVFWLWVGLLLFYVLLGVADYIFQRHKIMKQLRMSKEEVAQEHKDIEGDPHIKRRQRELQQEIQSGSLAQSVQQSAVIVRNPTHIAVCLSYHPVDVPVPKVLEKGTKAKAQQIINLAHQAAIPVVENIPLARVLYDQVDCGQTIPETLFEPVAALLRLVLEIDYGAEWDK